MPLSTNAFGTHLPSPPKLRDPAILEFLELRIALVRVKIDDGAGLENAREALRVVGRNANHAIRNMDVRHTDDHFASACFAARSQVAEARQLLATASVNAGDLVRARRKLY